MALIFYAVSQFPNFLSLMSLILEAMNKSRKMVKTFKLIS